MTRAGEAPARRPGGWFFALGLLGVLLLAGLGIWQVQRLAWKQDLIARVEAGLAADPTPAPGPEFWPALTRERDEYRRVILMGEYLPAPDILVQAVTRQGAGYWVMAPFRAEGGWSILVNRGFVPQDARDPATRPLPTGVVEVSGLLRMSQPDGAFLRENDPAGGRWFSRDTAAMAETLNLTGVAPWFLDRGAEGPGLPIGGLTVVSFPNNHLSYAITWFVMAAGLLGLLIWLWRGHPRRG